jgi:nucleoside-diphosphate-sugar epimerase
LSTNKVLIVGCGDIGIALGLRLAASGNEVWGLRRSTGLPAPLKTITADVSDVQTLGALIELTFDYAVVILTPDSATDEAYKSVYVDGLSNVLEQLKQARSVKRLLFVSSTSVYHQSGDEWVDENSLVQPENFSGKRLRQAELVLANSGINYSIIRFGGIYGPGRRRLIDQVRAGVGCARTPVSYTNRIHRDDCVGFLQHLIVLCQQGKEVDSLYVGVDCEPATMWDVRRWLAEKMNIDPSQLEPANTRRGNSKRCSNQRLLATGYQLRYPNYKLGYAEILDSL